MVSSTALTIPGGGRLKDGTGLKQRLQRAERRRRVRAVLLVVPLFLFLALTFVLPIATLLLKSVYDPELANTMPQTRTVIASWDGRDLPSENVFAAFAADMRAANEQKTTGFIGKRLNYEIGGIRSIVIKTGRELFKRQAGPWKDAILSLNPIWGKRDSLGRDQARGQTGHPLLRAIGGRSQARCRR